MTAHDRPTRNSGFTLIELLVVIGLVATLSVLIGSGLSGTSNSTKLKSAQGMIANVVAAVRIKAMSSGHEVRLLVNNDLGDAERYRCVLAIVGNDISGKSIVLSIHRLPSGTYVLPYKTRFTAGLTQANDSWYRLTDTGQIDQGDPLASSALQKTETMTAGSELNEIWEYWPVTGNGTTSQQGTIIVALGRERAPGEYTTGQSPVVLEKPEQVRGVILSSYGLARMVDDRGGF